MCEILSLDVYDSSVHNAVCGGLKRLYYENKLFDVLLITKDDQISAHKIVLASAATFFKLFFTSELTSRSVSSVDISFCDSKILKQLVHFIYTGEINLSQKNIVSLVELEDFLGVGLLHHHLSHYMLTTINDYNCWSYHEIADRHGFADVFVKVDCYIRKNFIRLISTGKPEFLNISPDQLLSFFSSDFLAISDHERLLLVGRGASDPHSGLCQWMGAAPDDRLAYLEELLNHVDIARISCWRGMSDRLAAYFNSDYQAPVTDWADRIGSMRDMLDRKTSLKGVLVEVILLIGGMMGGSVVPSVDTFIPPILLSRVLPLSVDHKRFLIIPPMFERRYKPTAAASEKAVYVIGGTHNHEELKTNGISCEVYKLKENKWNLLPNLPQSKTLKISSNRRPPAAFVEGNLYVALPSPKPSFWMLSRNEKYWMQLQPPKSYEVYDLVSCCSAVYCIGRQFEESLCYLLERYDAYSDSWVEVSVFSIQSSQQHLKGVCIDSWVCIASLDEELSTLSPLAVIVLHEDDVEVVLKEVKKEKVDEDEDTSNVEIEHHHIQSTIICHSCGAEFAEETELEKHRHIINLETHQREECGKEPTLKCSLCDERFHFKPQLNAHLIDFHSKAKLGSPQRKSSQSQLPEEQYPCKLCPRSFTRVGSLNYHLSRKHSGDNKRSAEEFPYLCPTCGNRYKSSTQLCRHRRWECGKEPMFQCQLCIKKFHHRHGLKQHMKLHIAKNEALGTGKGSYASFQFCCEKCGRGYKLRSSLNNHIRWECGKEPVFPCSVCDVRFTHKGNLKKHILTKHVVKVPQDVAKQEDNKNVVKSVCETSSDVVAIQ
ncbi:unnamed protein product [Nezara viridula]|uniref:Uncharacterized protein n=1 Tax=Nezara viridula TaxID=85310 RepID=A0A9P0MP58_NEZVI|nr:unnamed protein product [Nezara viridula]